MVNKQQSILFFLLLLLPAPLCAVIARCFEVQTPTPEQAARLERASGTSFRERRAASPKSTITFSFWRTNHLHTRKIKMANDSLDDMLGWLDEAMGEKDVHQSPTIAVGRAGSHKPHYGRSHSCDEIHHHNQTRNNNNNKTRAPSRRHHYTHHRSPEADDYRNDHVHDDRGYQRASSYSAIDSREMAVSSIHSRLIGIAKS